MESTSMQQPQSGMKHLNGHACESMESIERLKWILMKCFFHCEALTKFTQFSHWAYDFAMDNCIFSTFSFKVHKVTSTESRVEFSPILVPNSKEQRMMPFRICLRYRSVFHQILFELIPSGKVNSFQRTVYNFYGTDFSEFFNLNITFDNIGWCAQFPMRLKNSILINFIAA